MWYAARIDNDIIHTCSTYVCMCMHTCEGFAAVAPAVGRDGSLGLRLLAGEPFSTPAPDEALPPFEFIMVSCNWLPILPWSFSEKVIETEGIFKARSSFSGIPKSTSSTPPFKSSWPWGEEDGDSLFLDAVSFSFMFEPCGDFLAERLALGLEGDLATREEEGGGEGVLVHVPGLPGLRTLVRDE